MVVTHHFVFALAVALQMWGSLGESANPIRRVVTLLQKMQTQVTDEGRRDAQLYKKFQCYCTTGGQDLSSSITAAQSKVTQDTSSLEEAQAQSTQLTRDLAQHQTDRSDALDATARAKALRGQEAAVFSKESSDFKTNIAALGKAITAIEAGASGSFLQTVAASKLKEITIDMEMSSADRDIISAFLANRQAYVPRSGEITGILKQMKDTMNKDLDDVTGTEGQAITDYNALISAKAKEIAANTKAIESKTARLGQTNVDIVNIEEGLDDTTKAMLADQKFLANLDNSCDTKKKEFEDRSQTRTQELVALADTIRLLNDDDSLELFKATLPSPSLLQTEVSERAVRQQAVKLLKSSNHQHDPRVDMVMLALTGKSGNFDKVLKMIDNMVILLGKEQTDDDDKKTYCEATLDSTEDQEKEVRQSLSDLDKATQDTQENVENLAAEIAALMVGIKALDKSVSGATEARQAENAEYKATMAANTAAIDLIGMAKNRLMKFYNPSLHIAPAKVELSAEQRIAVNMGSEAAPTVAPSGIAGTGITYLQDSAPVLVEVSEHSQVSSVDDVAPPAAPETWGAYQKKGQEQSGVVAMMDLLLADLHKETQQMTVDEKDAQNEYEIFMGDSSKKRAQDSKAVSDKESNKAELESRLQHMAAEHKADSQREYATATTIRDLHLECDWLLSSYQARKGARAGEVDSLKSAKAVLSGADYSLVQQSQSRAVQLRGASQ